jgi:perosamine synthetase
VLLLALKAKNITQEVIVPSFTFSASVNAIVTAGATPVFVDINYKDCNIDVSKIEKQITEKTQAIMVVHFAGQCCEMLEINKICKKYNLFLIEDSAEAIGATYNYLPSGSWGVGCFSFFPTKNITTCEGGMLTTNDEELAEHVRTLSGHGIKKSTLEREDTEINWYRDCVIPGYNFRMSNILAAIGVEQMKRLDVMNYQRRVNSKLLISLLEEVEEINLPYENENCKHVYQMFTIKLKKGNRDNLVKLLRKNNIEASVHFTPAVHQQTAHKKFCKLGVDLKVTEEVANKIITLPMYPQLSQKEIEYIAKTLKKLIIENRG